MYFNQRKKIQEMVTSTSLFFYPFSLRFCNTYHKRVFY